MIYFEKFFYCISKLYSIKHKQSLYFKNVYLGGILKQILQEITTKKIGYTK